MEKPRICEQNYNMRRVGEASEGIRLVCLFAHNRAIIQKLITDAGGYESSGCCKEHEDFYIWWTNQPMTEEEERNSKKNLFLELKAQMEAEAETKEHQFINYDCKE